MPRTIRDMMPNDLKFPMFVLDELADDRIEQGADVLKLTIGVYRQRNYFTSSVADSRSAEIHQLVKRRRVATLDKYSTG